MPATSVCRRLCLPLLLALPLAVAAQTAALPGPETPDPSIEHQRQQQRTEALRRELERSADVRRPETPPADVGRLAGDETPCFQIREVTLTGADAAHFPWLAAARKGAAGDDPPEGRCLGSEGIRLVLKRLQNALLERGYLTSRVSAPNQDLSTGTLAIAVHAGRIEQARFSDDSPDRSSLRTAVPVQAGAILNLALLALHRRGGLDRLRHVTPTPEEELVRLARCACALVRGLGLAGLCCARITRMGGRMATPAAAIFVANHAPGGPRRP